ncbi:MAG: hypothetical protein K7J15_03425, partial [Candidatus Regiella insecticola]|nr:hypothetical protein [Candidatus Regiella insecticola]
LSLYYKKGKQILNLERELYHKLCCCRGNYPLERQFYLIIIIIIIIMLCIIIYKICNINFLKLIDFNFIKILMLL